VFGNAWTWCEDFFSSLPEGYGVHEFYDDFSSPCYDGEHSMIMGGSFMSTGDEASRFARFHFRCFSCSTFVQEFV
jgi:formylglycine-generating enzyme required for sulfatase activity